LGLLPKALNKGGEEQANVGCRIRVILSFVDCDPIVLSGWLSTGYIPEGKNFTQRAFW